MIRFGTCLLVLVLVACGSGGNTPSVPGGNPLAAFFPVDVVNVGSKATHELVQDWRRGAIQVKGGTRTQVWETARLPGAGGAPVHYVGAEGDAASGVGWMWTDRGLELLGFAGTPEWGIDGVCVTATSPGLLVAPTGFDVGQTHQCSLVGTLVPLTQARLTWNGPEAVAGHPGATKLTLVLAGEYLVTDPTSPRAAATSWRLTIVLHLAPAIGPVLVDALMEFLDPGGTSVEDRRYVSTMTGFVPGP